MPGLRNLQVLKSKEIKEIRKFLKEQWDAELDKNLVFFLNTKENDVYITNQKIGEVNFNKFNINTIGLYLGELFDKEFRPSMDGAQLIAKTATKNMVEISSEEAKAYLQGKDLEKETGLKGYLLLKSGKDILGAS